MDSDLLHWTRTGYTGLRLATHRLGLATRGLGLDAHELGLWRSFGDSHLGTHSLFATSLVFNPGSLDWKLVVLLFLSYV